MAKNIFFIVSNDDEKFSEIIKVAIGNEISQRASLCGKFTLIKLPEGDRGDYVFFEKYKPYTYAEIIKELDKENWAF